MFLRRFELKLLMKFEKFQIVSIYKIETNRRNMTNNTTAVLSFAIYMANAWEKGEAIKIFGENLGNHIFNKWAGYSSDGGLMYASMKLVYELDSDNLEKLVNRACECYEGRTRRLSSHIKYTSNL